MALPLPARRSSTTLTLAALSLAAALAGCSSEEPRPEGGGEPIVTEGGVPRAASPLDAKPIVGPLAGLVVLADEAGSASYELARGLREQASESAVTPLETAGSLESLFLVAWGYGDLAVVQADVLQDPAYRPLSGSVEVVTPLYAAAVHVIVAPGSPVKSLADLRGQTVAVGAQGSGAATTARTLLDAAEVYDVAFERAGGEAAVRKLRAGEVQAIVAVGGAPLPLLLRHEDLGLLEVPAELVAAMQKVNPNYRDGFTLRYGDREAHTATVPALLVKHVDVDASAVPAISELASGELPGAHPALAQRLESFDWSAPREGLSVTYRDPSAPVRFAAGSAGGSYAEAALALARAFEDADATVEVHETAGSLTNLMALATGEADLAIVQEDVLLEALRSPATSPLLARVRLITPLFSEQVHHVGAASGGAVEGTKSVGSGRPGSGTSVTANRLLRHAEDVVFWPVGGSQALDLLRSGRLAAAYFVGAQPIDLLRGSEVSFGEVFNDAYTPASLNPEAYPELTTPVPTVSTRALLLARFNMEPEQVEALTQALFANRANLARLQPLLSELEPAASEEQPEGLRIHSGVGKARETGLRVDSAEAW